MKLVFEAAYDLADFGDPIGIGIEETGGPNKAFEVILTSGLYFLSVDGATLTAGDFPDLVSDIDSLLSTIEAALNANTGGGSYSVTFDDETERVRFTHDGGGGITSFSIGPTALGADRFVGLTGMLSGSLSHECQRTPDFVIASSVGFWSDWESYEGGDDIAYDVEAHDGTPGGAAKEGAATYVDFTVPLEPAARVGNFPHLVSPAQPWTWRDFWRHCRNVEPFAMRDDAGLTLAMLLRAEGARFRPRKRGDNYIAHWDLPFRARELARTP